MKQILFLCAMGIFLFGCQKKTRPIDDNQQILRLNIHTEPPSLDARKANDTSSIAIINMCFEGLMKRGKEGAIEPAIAHRVEISDDNLTYTFHLRPAKWWDGRAVTAQDFETTWKTILNPSFPSGFAQELYTLKNGMAAKNGMVSINEVGVVALDEETLQVELDHPVPYFLDLVASHAFLAVPAHITKLSPHWADDGSSLFVGNGPYKLTEWKHHNSLTLKRNDEYWDVDSVTMDEIHMYIVQDEMTELNMFESDELDWAGQPLSTLPTDALQALGAQGRLQTYPMSGTYYYIFNCQQPPFDNVHFRKAFSLAINRKTIIENITQSKQIPATGFIPPTIWQINPHFEDNDIQEAKKLFSIALKEMGYTRDTLPPITLIYNTCAAHHKIAQVIQEQWFRAFGIRVKLANMEWKVFLNELMHKQFQVARMGGIGTFNDPMTFFDLYRYPHSSNNYSGWSNTEFTELIQNAEMTVDPIKRELFLREAEKIFMDEMPIAPIYYYTGTYIKKKYVKGIQLSEFSDANFKFAFLEL